MIINIVPALVKHNYLEAQPFIHNTPRPFIIMVYQQLVAIFQVKKIREKLVSRILTQFKSQ